VPFEPNSKSDVVPRRMLELVRDALRLCLARNVTLQERLEACERAGERLRAEIARLKVKR
jgi:hypothetical protein